MLSKSFTRVSSNAVRMSKRLSSYQSGSEGATASSKGGFSDKEKAVENQWARLHDAEKLKQLRELMLKQEERLQKHEKDNAALKSELEQLKTKK